MKRVRQHSSSARRGKHDTYPGCCRDIAPKPVFPRTCVSLAAGTAKSCGPSPAMALFPHAARYPATGATLQAFPWRARQVCARHFLSVTSFYPPLPAATGLSLTPTVACSRFRNISGQIVRSSARSLAFATIRASGPHSMRSIISACTSISHMLRRCPTCARSREYSRTMPSPQTSYLPQEKANSTVLLQVTCE